MELYLLLVLFAVSTSQIGCAPEANVLSSPVTVSAAVSVPVSSQVSAPLLAPAPAPESLPVTVQGRVLNEVVVESDVRAFRLPVANEEAVSLSEAIIRVEQSPTVDTGVLQSKVYPEVPSPKSGFMHDELLETVLSSTVESILPPILQIRSESLELMEDSSFDKTTSIASRVESVLPKIVLSQNHQAPAEQLQAVQKSVDDLEDIELTFVEDQEESEVDVNPSHHPLPLVNSVPHLNQRNKLDLTCPVYEESEIRSASRIQKESFIDRFGKRFLKNQKKRNNNSKKGSRPEKVKLSQKVQSLCRNVNSEKGKKLCLQGRIQEAIWVSQRDADSGDLEQTLPSLKVALKEILCGSPTQAVDDKLLLSEGVEGIYKRDGGSQFFEDYQQANIDEDSQKIFFANSDSEVGAYTLDQLLGLNIVPMTVLREFLPNSGNHLGSLQYFVKGGLAGRNSKNRQSFGNMMILDYLSGNDDRHRLNWLYLKDIDQIVAIDHGKAFRSFEGGCILSLSSFPLQFFTFDGQHDRNQAFKCPTQRKLQRIEKQYGDIFEMPLFNMLRQGAFSVFQSQWLSESVKLNILNVTDTDLRFALKDFVRKDAYLEKVITRLHHLQDYFKNFDDSAKN